MKALALALLLLTLAIAAVRADASGVVIRSRLDPAEGAVVGQPVRLLVDVLFPDAMPRPPRVAPPSVAGAQIFRFESQGLTIRERIDGRDYVGQRFEFALFARRVGAIAVPGAQVSLLDPAGEVVGSATADPLRMTAAAPPGIDAAGPVIASTSVTASQSWTPDPVAPLKPGGALVRTIMREAVAVPALAMAELTFAAPEGVRVYVEPPVSDDHVNRGVVTGRRTDKVTYVFEQPGRLALPEVAQPWWDLDGQQARAERLPGVEIEVSAASSHSERLTEGRWVRPLLLAAAIAALFCLLFVGSKVRSAYHAWRERRAMSEAAALSALCAAARSGDAVRTFRALETWRSRMSAAGQESLASDGDLRSSVSALERSLFGAGLAWSDEDGRDLARLIEAFRPSARPARRRPPALPPLNPAKAP